MKDNKITARHLTQARLIYDGIEKGRALEPASMSSDYNNGDALKQWIDNTVIVLSAWSDPDTRDNLNSWMKESNRPDIIISKLIAIASTVTPFPYDLFTIYQNAELTVSGLLSSVKQSVDDFAMEEEIARVEAGENVNAVMSDYAADPVQAAAAAPVPAANPGYIPVPPAYVITGEKTTGDYMDQLYGLGYNFRLNNVTNRIEVNGEDKSDSIESEIYLAMRDKGYKGRAIIQDCINVVAKQNEYHPIRNYLTSLTWDGTEVLDPFIGLLDPSDPVYAGVIFRKWMISVVAKVMTHAQNSMLVLEGDQGTGKSQFARWLCPLPKYFRESAIQPDNKDHEISACGKWLWEVKELSSTTRRADQDALKGFLTAEEFTFRPAYARNDITRPALASYIGTVNNSSGFLIDVTGNRRFWTIGTGNINWAYSTLYNPDDLWAEAYARWKRGESFTLTKDENNSLLESQEQYKVVNMTAEAMTKYFDIDLNKVNDPLWSIPVIDVRECLRNNGLSEADVNPRRIGDAAKELNIPVKKVKRNGKTVTTYFGIRTKNNFGGSGY